MSEPEEDEDPVLELLLTQNSFETEQETGPDRPHQDTATRPRIPRIKWPKASDRTLWKQLDEDLDNILEASLQGPVDRKLTTLTTLIYSVGKERFGLEEERVQKRYSKTEQTANPYPEPETRTQAVEAKVP